MLINFLRSLTLMIIFSFTAPIFLIGAFFSIIFLFGYLPGLGGMTEAITTLVLEFLTIFGNGAPLRGVVVISFTCSFVGVLFDAYAYYRYQILR
ncbi:hypothetical protein G7B40_010020 [Aetokthonos hydrillicola Thurmond2011]|jgi:fatty acid desaturase|uniref:Uncharacterized protein n=2 Tax=Aetokthonos TaxID=1550243 RepID=A0AAP5I9G1_9CYAN|nr:hypothetical protein [Aetokthonos hydrillicola CCALA 1050]MBW4590046.1 hypothetical protein [Aetokthonos hydrillicola CCALA 1050]MDR9894900.1 hypothetical protein [Aetokthonos hydrillicola Thurmond2011]